MSIQRPIKKEVLKQLKVLQAEIATEKAHRKADNLLLDYIGNSEITKEYNKIDKWYRHYV